MKKIKILIEKYGYSQWYYLFVILFVLSSFFAFLLTKDFSGLMTFTIKSNSMSPTFNKGSFIVTVKQTNYQPGDIITYYSKVKPSPNLWINNREEIVTHRIVKFGGNVYLTKGDANVAVDPELVVPRLIIGKVFLIFPTIGYFIGFAKTSLGMFLTIIFPAVVAISIEILKIVELIKTD